MERDLVIRARAGDETAFEDLIAARLEEGLPLRFEVDGVPVHDLESERPRIRYRHDQLDVDALRGIGFQAVYPDGTRGPIRRTRAEAKADLSEPPKEAA